MVETAVTVAPVTVMSLIHGGIGGATSGGAPNSNLSISDWNSFRMSAVIDRFSSHFYGNRSSEPAEFPNLCLSLARSIDFAIGNNMVPSRSQELPLLIKQVCQSKSDSHVQATKMVLMISVKSACQNGWFTDGDSEELINLAKEIGTSFCSVSNFSAEPNCHLSVISTIMSRFYPRMKMGHILTFLCVKPGYDAYLKDFQITKNIISSPEDKIMLFVVKTDNMETSSCLVSPAKVNFLLNGKGVERRTNLSLDTGPQMPTTVNNVLKYGTNLLQAVGEFNAVAFTSEVPNPDSNALQDYEQHAPATVDTDSEVIVGPSRISLNCPISFKKIKNPVKGHSCKHIQCFDFHNYVDINSRRPSWRCPRCNQYVCFTDIRIDQKMVKDTQRRKVMKTQNYHHHYKFFHLHGKSHEMILKEAGADVSDVLISSDGSWKAVTGSDDTIHKPGGTALNTHRDESPHPTDVLDLTNTDDAMDDVTPSKTEDGKQPPSAKNSTAQSNIQDDFWSAMFLSTFRVGSSNGRENALVGNNPVPTSDLADSFISPDREGALDAVPQNGTPSPNALQLQQYQCGNNPQITNEYGRFPSLPRNVTRTPTAVQALPTQTPTSPHLQRGYTNNSNAIISQNESRPAALQASPNFPVASRAHTHQGSPVSSSPLSQHSTVQQQNNSCPSARPPERNASFQGPNQVPNTYRAPNVIVPVPQATSQPPRLTQPLTQSTSSFSRPQSTQQSQLIAAANQAVQMSFEPSRAVPPYSMTSRRDQRGSLGIASEQVTNGYDATSEMNWRPAARMRGALSGQAYAEAYNQAMNRPNNQQAQAVRPIRSTSVLTQSQGFVAGGVQGMPGGTGQGIPASTSAGSPMSSDVLSGGSAATN
ncbi:hypothetical protein OROMI_008996 [Orobanche minor]